MSDRRPTIRQLEYASALADHLNFRKAAAACWVSQPALSAQIQSLEATVGAQLFERDRRSVRLTPAGHLVVQRARAILGQVDELVVSAQSDGDELVGELRLGVIPTIGPYVLPRILPAMRKAYPQLRLLIHEDQTARLVGELERGRLELLLVALEADLGEAETVALFDEAFLLAMPPDHRLAQRKRVRLEDLQDEQVMLLEDGHCLRETALEVCNANGAHELADFRATSLGTLVQMVVGGLGVTLLPEMAVPAETRSARGLVAVPFVGRGAVRRIGLAWRPAAARKAAFEGLAELIEARLAAPGG